MSRDLTYCTLPDMKQAMISFSVLALSTGGLLVAATTVSAQSRAEQYVVGAVGGWSNRFASGGLVGAAAGVEVPFVERFGAGAEIGVLGGSSGAFLLSISVDGKADLGARPASQTLAPVIVGGYTYVKFFELSDHAWNLGGGAEYRISPRRAIRVELRDIIRRSGTLSHYWSIRVGVAFC